MSVDDLPQMLFTRADVAATAASYNHVDAILSQKKTHRRRIGGGGGGWDRERRDEVRTISFFFQTRPARLIGRFLSDEVMSVSYTHLTLPTNREV